MRYFRLHTGKSPSASKRGYAGLLGMLIVLVIIMYLIYEGYFTKNPKTGVSQAQTQIERANEIACQNDRGVLHDQVLQFQMSNSNVLPSTAILKVKLGSIYHCKSGGKFQLDKEGNVYCTKHFPAPESLTASIINLQD